MYQLHNPGPAFVQQLLTQLQALYQQLTDQDTTGRREYYQHRILLIEKALRRLAAEPDCAFGLMDEFLPEYQILSASTQSLQQTASVHAQFMGLN